MFSINTIKKINKIINSTARYRCFKACLLALIGLFTGMTATFAQQLNYAPKLIKGQLPNGLTYYIYPNQTPKGEAVYRLFIKAGSVMEEDHQRGLAHFLEHIAFNGTRHFPGDGIIRFLESKGAKFGKDLNAHTSFNETVYKLQLPSADKAMVDSTLTILADWADGMLIDSVEVEKERGVIISEWISRGGTNQDSGMKLVMELLNGSRFADRITIGDTAVIRHASPQVLRDYYERWYHPSLMAVAVVGDIDPQHIEKTIREKFSDLHTPTAAPQWKQPVIPKYSENKAVIYENDKLNKIEFDMLQISDLPGNVQTAEDYGKYLLRAVIGRLFKLRFNALSFDNPDYAKASVQYSGFLNAAGVSDASAELVKGKLRSGIRDFILSQQQMYRYGFTESEIARVKKSMHSRMKKKVDASGTVRSSEIMNDIYGDFYDGYKAISRADELELMEKYLPTIDSVSIIKNIQDVFETENMHFLLRGKNLKDEFESEQDLLQFVNDTRQLPVERYYKYLDVPDDLCEVQAGNHIVSQSPIDAIDAVDIRLDNGARVIYRKSPTEEGRVFLSGFRKGGLYAVDSTYYYTGLIGPSIISLSGAGEFTRDELSHFLAGNSASMRFLVDKLRTGVAGSAFTEDAEDMFKLLWLKWTQPRLDTAVCRITLEKLIESDSLKQETPMQMFSRELKWIMNGKDYTNTELTADLVRTAIKPAEMLPLQHRFYGSANGFTFIVTGDSELEELLPYINTYIGALPKGHVDTTWIAGYRDIPQKDLEFIRHNGTSNKATVMLMYQQDKPFANNADLSLQADVSKAVLRTALLKRLREDMGKVYSVSVSSSSTPYPRFLSRSTIAFVCAPEDAELLIEETGKVIEQVFSEPQLFAQALDDVKQNLIKDNGLQKQRTVYWTSGIRNAVYFNDENWKALNDYEERVKALSMEDIQNFLKKAMKHAHHIKAILYPATEK